jgi:hypothetical protein
MTGGVVCEVIERPYKLWKQRAELSQNERESQIWPTNIYIRLDTSSQEQIK